MDFDNPFASSFTVESDVISSSGDQTRQNSESDVIDSLSSQLGSWSGLSWGNIISNVKKQSVAVVDLYKQDIKELISTVNEDSEEAFMAVKESLKAVTHLVEEHDAVPQSSIEGEQAGSDSDRDADGFQTGVLEEAEKILDDIDALAEQAENIIGSGIVTLKENLSSFITNAIKVVPPTSNARHNFAYDRKSAMITELKKDPNTYLADPATDNSLDDDGIATSQRFATFLASFDEETHSNEISSLLNLDEDINSLYQKFVPQTMSSKLFWARYFFRVNEIETQERRRKALVQTVEGIHKQQSEELFSWDWDDEDENQAPPKESNNDEVDHSDQVDVPQSKDSESMSVSAIDTKSMCIDNESPDVSKQTATTTDTESFELIRDLSMQTISSLNPTEKSMGSVVLVTPVTNETPSCLANEDVHTDHSPMTDHENKSTDETAVPDVSEVVEKDDKDDRSRTKIFLEEKQDDDWGEWD